MSISSKKRIKNEHAQSVATKIILDSIADGVFTVDNNWDITSFNRAAESITGIPSKKAIGQKCFDVFHANICQTTCALEETLRTGKQIIDLHINILNNEGNIIPVSISTAVIKDKNRNIPFPKDSPSRYWGVYSARNEAYNLLFNQRFCACMHGASTVMSSSTSFTLFSRKLIFLIFASTLGESSNPQTNSFRV